MMGHEFLNKTLQMALSYLREIPPLSQLKTENDLVNFLGGGHEAATTASAVMGRMTFLFQDMFKVLKSLQVEVGLTLRFPSGETITFFPIQGETKPPAAKENYSNVQSSHV